MFSHKHNFIDILRNINQFEESPTIKLLMISIYVSISGIFRVFISSILLNTHINLVMGLACGLIIYSVYTFDRITDVRFLGSDKVIGVTASLCAAFIGIGVFYLNGQLLLGIFPFAICYLYSKGLKIGKHTYALKAGYGFKNLVIGSTWGILIVGSAGFGNFIPFIIVFLLYGVKLFCNSNENDFKDITSDSLAGLKTLPVLLGAQKLKIILLSLHILAHLIVYSAMLNGIITLDYIILLCSFFCGGFCILNCNNAQTPISRFFRDGESTMTVLLLLAAHFLW
jgi:4-hydroxybenzoate polyprenyltransferase